MDRQTQSEKNYQEYYIYNREGEQVMFSFFLYLIIEFVGYEAGHAGNQSSETAEVSSDHKSFALIRKC